MIPSVAKKWMETVSISANDTLHCIHTMDTYRIWKLKTATIILQDVYTGFSNPWCTEQNIHASNNRGNPWIPNLESSQDFSPTICWQRVPLGTKLTFSFLRSFKIELRLQNLQQHSYVLVFSPQIASLSMCRGRTELCRQEAARKTINDEWASHQNGLIW